MNNKLIKNKKIFKNKKLKSFKKCDEEFYSLLIQTLKYKHIELTNHNIYKQLIVLNLLDQ